MNHSYNNNTMSYAQCVGMPTNHSNSNSNNQRNVYNTGNSQRRRRGGKGRRGGRGRSKPNSTITSPDGWLYHVSIALRSYDIAVLVFSYHTNTYI